MLSTPAFGPNPLLSSTDAPAPADTGAASDPDTAPDPNARPPGEAVLLSRGLDSPVVSNWPKDGGLQYRRDPDGLICFNRPLELETTRRLWLLDDFPIACQGVIMANRDKCAEDAAANLKFLATKHALELDAAYAKTDSKWSWWQVALVTGAGVVAGFGAGVLYGVAR